MSFWRQLLKWGHSASPINRCKTMCRGQWKYAKPARNELYFGSCSQVIDNQLCMLLHGKCQARSGHMPRATSAHSGEPASSVSSAESSEASSPRSYSKANLSLKDPVAVLFRAMYNHAGESAMPPSPAICTWAQCMVASAVNTSHICMHMHILPT
jgi:hypothetical protein